ncbi:NAD(P)H:quinone oxidoreductase, type IV [Spinellus fusiger]|nr:NAD(P)H:quinone oxidoreductase, type IV [Spinellus fusiger]
MPVVYIIFYSVYGHIYDVAQSVKQGIEATGVQVKLFQVAETLSNDVLQKMYAPPKPDVPIITIDKLVEADGIMFGIPTRFGTMPAQMKAFLDSTSSLWSKGALSGKFAGTFFSTANQHGGQETTALTAIPFFAHHGLIYVPLGFTNPHLFDISEVVGGSAYGSGTIAGNDGSRKMSQKEKELAFAQGEGFGKIVSTFHKGVQSIKEKTPSGSVSDKAVKKKSEHTKSSRLSKSISSGDIDKKNKCFCM